MTNVSFCRLARIVPAPFADYILPYVRGDIARRASADCLVLGAIWNGLACGAAVVEWADGGGDVRSLFVDPKARGCGVAGHMLDLALEEAARRGVQTLFLDYVLRRDELAAMDALVLSKGGSWETGAPICGLQSDDFLDSPLLGPALRADWQRPPGVVLFSELTERQRTFLETGPSLPPFLRPSALGLRLDGALSPVYLAGDVPAAFALGFQSGERMFCQSAVWRAPDAPEGSLRALICTQANQCLYRSGGSFVFYISPVNPRSAALAEWFTGGNYEPYSQREAVIPVPVRGRLGGRRTTP